MKILRYGMVTLLFVHAVIGASYCLEQSEWQRYRYSQFEEAAASWRNLAGRLLPTDATDILLEFSVDTPEVRYLSYSGTAPQGGRLSRDGGRMFDCPFLSDWPLELQARCRGARLEVRAWEDGCTWSWTEDPRAVPPRVFVWTTCRAPARALVDHRNTRG